MSDKVHYVKFLVSCFGRSGGGGGMTHEAPSPSVIYIPTVTGYKDKGGFGGQID
jgi:hypothetical protein